MAVHGPIGISTDVYYYDSSGHVVGTLESLGSYATASEVKRAEAVAAKDAVFGSVLGSLAYAGADLAGASQKTKNDLAIAAANLSEFSFAAPGVAARAKIGLASGVPSDPFPTGFSRGAPLERGAYSTGPLTTAPPGTFSSTAGPTASRISEIRRQVGSLTGLGLDRTGRRALFEGRPVLAELPTQGGDATIATFQLRSPRLTAGIFSIHNETGGGLRAFADFRSRARALAREFGAAELELQGQAVINQDIRGLLVRQGFAPKTVDVPVELGGGTMDILFRVYPTR